MQTVIDEIAPDIRLSRWIGPVAPRAGCTSDRFPPAGTGGRRREALDVRGSGRPR